MVCRISFLFQISGFLRPILYCKKTTQIIILLIQQIMEKHLQINLAVFPVACDGKRKIRLLKNIVPNAPLLEFILHIFIIAFFLFQEIPCTFIDMNAFSVLVENKYRIRHILHNKRQCSFHQFLWHKNNCIIINHHTAQGETDNGDIHFLVGKHICSISNYNKP